MLSDGEKGQQTNALVMAGLYMSVSYALKITLERGFSEQPFDQDWLEEMVADAIRYTKNLGIDGRPIDEEAAILRQVADAFDKLIRKQILDARNAANDGSAR